MIELLSEETNNNLGKILADIKRDALKAFRLLLGKQQTLSRELA